MADRGKSNGRSGRGSGRGAAARIAAAAGVAGLGVALAACSGYAYGPGPNLVGAPQDRVVERLGPPTGRYTLPDGSTRLEFARGPFGRHTWMIDLDAQGRAARVTQALTEANFLQVRDGDPREAVLQRLGRPSEVRRVGLQPGEVWSWRYDADNNCLWFQVSIIDGAARQPGHAIDPTCDAPSDARD